MKVMDLPQSKLPKIRYAQQVLRLKSEKGMAVLYFLVMLSMTFACAIFYIWCQTQMAEANHQMSRQWNLQRLLKEETQNLESAIARQKSLARLIGLAKNQYRMMLPVQAQVVNPKSVPVALKVPSKVSPAFETQTKNPELVVKTAGGSKAKTSDLAKNTKANAKASPASSIKSVSETNRSAKSNVSRSQTVAKSQTKTPQNAQSSKSSVSSSTKVSAANDRSLPKGPARQNTDRSKLNKMTAGNHFPTNL